MKKFMEELRQEEIRRELDRQFPEMDYRNGIVAKMIATGKAEKLTEDWMRNAILRDFEEGFIPWGTAVEITDCYTEAVKRLA